MAVLVLGGLILDFICEVKTLDQHANMITSLSRNLGGMGYNTARACARLGVKTELISGVGPDMIDLPQIQNLKLSLQKSKTVSTRCFLFHSKDGERQYFCKGAYDEIDPAKCAESVKKADIVHLAGIIPSFLEIAGQAKALDKKVCFNPGYDIHHYEPRGKLVRGLIRYADYIILNLEEYKRLGVSAEELAKGKEAVICTNGAEGSEIYTQDSKTKIGAYKVRVASPFGAGDTFTGAFLAATTKGFSITESVKVSSAAASFAVEQTSTAPELNWDAVLERAKRIG